MEPKLKKLKSEIDCNTKVYNFLNCIYYQITKFCICNETLEFFIESFDECCNCIEKNCINVNNYCYFLSIIDIMCQILEKQLKHGVICSQLYNICKILCNSDLVLKCAILNSLSSNEKLISYCAYSTLFHLLILNKSQKAADLISDIIRKVTSSNNILESEHSLMVLYRLMEWQECDHPSEQMKVFEGCHMLTVVSEDSEISNNLKSVILKALEIKWIEMLNWFHSRLIFVKPELQSCLLSFMNLWHQLISIRTNLSVVDIRQFQNGVDVLLESLNLQTPTVLWKAALSIANELLCYSSTIALQDAVEDEPLHLAQAVVSFKGNFHFMKMLPIISLSTTYEKKDNQLLQKITLLLLKALAVLSKDTRGESEDSSEESETGSESNLDITHFEHTSTETITQLDIFIKSHVPFHPQTYLNQWIVKLLGDQDDVLIEALICILDIHVTIQTHSNSKQLLEITEPVTAFCEFLSMINYDTNVLLDLMVSNETSFLLFLLKILKYIKHNWTLFCEKCTSQLDSVMTVLIQLNLLLERLVDKDLFPYNICPVLRLLEQCEQLYEWGSTK